MNFLKKIKPVVLNCYTNSQSVYLAAPVKAASEFVPTWWKELPTTINYEDPDIGVVYPHGTLRGCVGFNNLFRQGFMLPMWSDCMLKIGSIKNQNYGYKFSDNKSNIGLHSSNMYAGCFEASKYQHLKFHSPWAFSCSEEIKFAFLQPTWNHQFEQQIVVLPGVVEYKYQHCTDVNVMLKRDIEDYQILISTGTPVAHIVPLTERNVILKTHLISTSELKQFAQQHGRLKFLSSYSFYKKMASKNKCPFHKQ